MDKYINAAINIKNAGMNKILQRVFVVLDKSKKRFIVVQ